MLRVLKEIPPLPPGWLKVSEHRERWEILRQEAQEEARRCARVLIDEYGASRVWLIGSAAGEWIFHDYSDVDIVVEGLGDRVFTRAWTRVPDLSRFRIDLRPRDEFTEEQWARLIPQPVLIAERS
jgi:predicted nucleotidyltransferase